MCRRSCRDVAVRSVAVLALLLTLPACSDDPAPDPEPAVHTADDGEVYNDADAAFAADLVQHHALALTLVDLSRGASVSPDVAGVAEDILTTQSQQIETLTDLLAAWDRPIPETVRDHAHAGHDEARSFEGDLPGGELPGMPTAEDLTDLQELRGAAFEERWLELMIAHHEGAVEIAEGEVADGRHAAAVDLAQAVGDAQRRRLDQMRDLLEQ